MTKVYTALSEYRRDLFREAEMTGVPVVRHLWLHYPNDPVVFDHELQFLLGRDILVAPHVEKCLLPWCDFAQEVYLPEDTWVHLWSGEVYTGGDTVSVNAPIGYPAVFYRQNSVVMSDVLDAMRDAGLDVHP
jgi:alpha-glucosidase